MYEDSLKTRNARSTSKESFRILTESGQRIKEKLLIYEAIKTYQPVTSRALSQITGKERTNITRSLYDLVHELIPQIKEAFTDTCPTTGKRVTWYTLIDWKREQYNGAEQLKLYE